MKKLKISFAALAMVFSFAVAFAQTSALKSPSALDCRTPAGTLIDHTSCQGIGKPCCTLIVSPFTVFQKS
jgi:Family of unknown function (DUF6520)